MYGLYSLGHCSCYGPCESFKENESDTAGVPFDVLWNSLSKEYKKRVERLFIEARPIYINDLED